MVEDLQASIYPVESSLPDNNVTGTGFVIYQHKQVCYLLTCAHVVEDVGTKNVLIDGMAASINTIGASNDVDLAVLCVEGLPRQTVPELLAIGKEGDAIEIIGIHDYGQYRSRKIIHGYLGPQSGLKKPKTQGTWIKAWELKLESDDYLQPGYSGSPVIHQNSGKVLAIVSHRRGKGDRGLAISVEVIEKLWHPGSQPVWMQNLVKTSERSGKEFSLQQVGKDKSRLEVEHLHTQIDGLEKAWKSLANKIEGLELERSHETRSNEIARLGYLLSQAKQQQKEIEAEINLLVTRLQQLES